MAVRSASWSAGLSPRLRGNPQLAPLDLLPQGSIPAPAGEPASGRWPRRRSRVYPRACGGTFSSPRLSSRSRGLSPRLRGNLYDLGDPVLGLRSIPAPAGEPSSRWNSGRWTWVYPRACGGTCVTMLPPSSVCGLSPRLRGNLVTGIINGRCNGSIPAPAGEPSNAPLKDARSRVYPRACGGTKVAFAAQQVAQGLSPRLRGNQRGNGRLRLRSGSIPAPAGEPMRVSSTRIRSWVYPRACGGTTLQARKYRHACGLSPRLRGNLA